jgi:hypothetical protein
MKTETTKINEWLRLFYEGGTSPEQEQELRRYFATTENIPDELQTDKEVFLKLSFLSDVEDSSIGMPQGFDERLEILLDGLAGKGKRPATVFRLWKQAVGIAASIAILLSAGIFFRQNKHHALTDTCSTPEIAYVETQRALLLVSERLNKGFSRLEKADQNISKVNEILDKKLN